MTRVIARQNERLDEARIVPQATLASLGFDSFALVSLMFDLEEEFHVEISDKMLTGIKTVADIIDGLDQLCRPVDAVR